MTMPHEMPQDLIAEASVLGAMLLRPTAIFEVVDLLKADHFFSSVNKKIYDACYQVALVDNHDLDIATLVSKLKSKRQHSAIGGNAYLDKLINTVPTAAHIRSYAEIVVEKARRRIALAMATDIQKIAYDETKQSTHIADFIEKKLLEIGGQKTSQIVSLQQSLKQVVEETQDDKAKKRMKTKFSQLDNFTGGLHNGDLVIVAGRPSIGKTSFSLNLALNFAKAAKNVLFFSLEMEHSELTKRLLASYGERNAHTIRVGDMSDDNKKTLIATADKMKDLNIWIKDDPMMSSAEIISTARRLSFKVDTIDLIVIDYLQLISEPRVKDRSRNDEVAYVSRRMKFLARELDTPVVCLSQLSRASARENRAPVMSDLRDSGAIEQDADLVIFLYSTDKQAKHNDKAVEVQLRLDKNRNGPTGNCTLMFNPVRQIFLTADKNA